MIRIYKAYTTLPAGSNNDFIFINPYKNAKIYVGMIFQSDGTSSAIKGEVLFNVYHRQKSYGLNGMFTYAGRTQIELIEVVNQIDLDDSIIEYAAIGPYGYFNNYIAGAGLQAFHITRVSGGSWSARTISGNIILTLVSITN